MPVMNPTLAQAMEWGCRKVVVCDHCPTIIDCLSSRWLEMHERGELYNGEIVCWRCKEARDDTG